MTQGQERTFLGATIPRRSLFALPLAVGGLSLAGCTPTSERQVPEEQSILAPEREPTPPGDIDAQEGYRYFSAEEARAVEAAVARIIPGDDEDPGAIQAGVPTYIDRKLAEFETFAEPTYLRGPFAEGYEASPPENPAPDTVPVAAGELYRYGHQSSLTAREVYRGGVPGLDRYSQTRFGALFSDLSEERQDQVLMVLDGVHQRSEAGSEGGEGGGVGTGGGSSGNDGGGGGGPSQQQLDQAEDVFGEVDPGAFFATLREDTIEGMFADPAYGGNRNLVGWQLIGYPGAQRSYSPHEMLHGTDKQPQSMHGLTPMNPDRAGGGRDALEQPRHGVHSH